MLDAKFYTLTIDDGGQILEPHDDRAEAEDFAREVVREGFDCAVIQVLSVERKECMSRVSLEKMYGVIPGVDFPGSFCGRAV